MTTGRVRKSLTKPICQGWKGVEVESEKDAYVNINYGGWAAECLPFYLKMISVMINSFSFRHIIKGSRGPISMDDIYPLDYYMTSESIENDFDKAWCKGGKKSGKYHE